VSEELCRWSCEVHEGSGYYYHFTHTLTVRSVRQSIADYWNCM
jgi:hypothetical protein